MRRIIGPALVATLTASPAFAATGPFFSLHNTDFVVLLAFLLFVAVLIYFKVPGKVAEMLDKRAATIKAELEAARALREEAQALLASYERKQKDVTDQAERIVASAREEAQRAADVAKEDIRTSVARRLAGAEEQIASAQNAAIKAVRDQAIVAAIGAAQDVIAQQMSAADADRLIDESIETVDVKLH